MRVEKYVVFMQMLVLLISGISFDLVQVKAVHSRIINATQASMLMNVSRNSSIDESQTVGHGRILRNIEASILAINKRSNSLTKLRGAMIKTVLRKLSVAALQRQKAKSKMEAVGREVDRFCQKDTSALGLVVRYADECFDARRRFLIFKSDYEEKDQHYQHISSFEKRLF